MTAARVPLMRVAHDTHRLCRVICGVEGELVAADRPAAAGMGRAMSASRPFICFRAGRWFLNIEGADEAVEVGPTDDDLYAMHEAVMADEATTTAGKHEIARRMRLALAPEPKA